METKRLKKPRGLDLSIWGWSHDKATLGSEVALRKFLTRLCELIKMVPLKESSVYVPIELERLGKEPRDDEGGSSAVLILSTSHAAIHGWPARHPDYGYFSCQVSSCREFEPARVINFVRSELDVYRDESSTLYLTVPPI